MLKNNMENRLYFNGKDNFELTDRIYSLIFKAKSYIKTGNFFFKDPKLKDALLEAASRGIAVFVLSNLTGNEERGRKTSVDVKSENDPHIPNLHELYEHGIHVRIVNELHAKFLIADDDNGLIMSANFTQGSLYGNPENGVDVARGELKDLEKVFDILYTHPDSLLAVTGEKYRYSRMSKHVPKDALQEIGSNNRLLLTAASRMDHTNTLSECMINTIYRRGILDIIRNAEKSILIVSWSFNALEKLPEFRNAIGDAFKRGVKINFLYGAQNLERHIQRNLDSLKKLINRPDWENYCFGLTDNHAKCIVSEKEGALFTNNIDGQTGLLSGFELGCLLTNEQRCQTISRLSQIIERNGK